MATNARCKFAATSGILHRMPGLRTRLGNLSADLPPEFWFLWLGTVINRLGGFVVPFLSLYLTSELGVPVGEAGVVVALFGAGSFAAQLTGGELTDRLGRRPVLLLSLLGAPPLMLALGFAHDLGLIRLLTAAGFTICIAQRSMAATTWFRSAREPWPSLMCTNINLVRPGTDYGAHGAHQLPAFRGRRYNGCLRRPSSGAFKTQPADVHAWRHLSDRFSQLARTRLAGVRFDAPFWAGLCRLSDTPLIQQHGLAPGLRHRRGQRILTVLITPAQRPIAKWPPLVAMVGSRSSASVLRECLVRACQIHCGGDHWTFGEIIGAAVLLRSS
jgi:hypothetical protein